MEVAGLVWVVAVEGQVVVVAAVLELAVVVMVASQLGCHWQP